VNDIRMLTEGGLTLLLGRSGAGKSLLAAAMAADITRGREPATGAPRRPGRVLFLYGDDRPETAARRLEAAGAAMDRLTRPKLDGLSYCARHASIAYKPARRCAQSK
jgi:RecA-family ATPase